MKQTILSFNDHASGQVATTHDAKASRPSPFCLRLSHEERQALEVEAGELPLGEYIRRCLFGASLTKRRKSRKAPDEDQKLIGQALAAFGRSRLPHNIAQLALSTQNSPQLFTAELCMVISGAQNDVEAIRRLLMNATGKRGAQVKSADLLKRVLAKLKNPHIAQKLNVLVKTIHVGAFALSPEVRHLILEVCAEIDAICTMLCKAVEVA